MTQTEELTIADMSEEVQEAVRRRVDERGMTIEEALIEVLSCGPAGEDGAVANVPPHFNY